MAHRWYVVHVYSGFERKIAEVDPRAGQAESTWTELITDVLVPTEEVVEVRRGVEGERRAQILPGLCPGEDGADRRDAGILIMNTPKVTGFLGRQGQAHRRSARAEAQRILHQVQEGIERPKRAIIFEIGEQVRVNDGPFTSFTGYGRGSRRGEGPPEGRGVDLRSRHAGRTGILAGREGLRTFAIC